MPHKGNGLKDKFCWDRNIIKEEISNSPFASQVGCFAGTHRGVSLQKYILIH